jgi:uncharacterized protein (DUF4415 family)
MPRKSRSSKRSWTDPDDGLPLTAAMAKRAEFSIGGKVIRPATGVLVNDRRGRPRMANPKQAVKLRIDADVLAYFRASGPGWQTRINKVLRKVARI